MEALKVLEVCRVPTSAGLSSPGDFAFVPKRQPVLEFERIPHSAPKGFFRKIVWRFFGKKNDLKQAVELLRPSMTR